MRVPLGIVLLLLAGATAAEPIYESVDRPGRVSYSSLPPRDARTLSLLMPAPPPNEERVRQAQAQHELFAAYHAERDQERKERAKEPMRPRAAAVTIVVIERPSAVPVADRAWWAVPVIPPYPRARPAPRLGSGIRR